MTYIEAPNSADTESQAAMRQWLADSLNIDDQDSKTKDSKTKDSKTKADQADGSVQAQNNSDDVNGNITLENVQIAILAVMLGSLHAVQKIVGIQSSSIGANAAIQQKYNHAIEGLKWETVNMDIAKKLDTNGNTDYVTGIQEYNKHVQDLSSTYQSLVMSNRQGTQSTVTQANASVQSSEQIVSETSEIIKIQNQSFQEIEKISQPANH